ncbi:10384_t:CDS:2, partial [Scutellospora calospora]
KESSSSLKVNDSKEFSSSSKVNDDNENIQPKKLNITCEDQSNNKIKQHSSEDFEQEVKVSNITEQPNQEIVKKELSPVVNEPSLQSSESKQINANPVQNINTNQILLNGKTYTRIEYLGRGGSSKVYKVKDSNSQVFALKKVSFHKVEESTIAGYINEIDLLEKLYGRTRIIKLYDHEIDYEKKTYIDG